MPEPLIRVENLTRLYRTGGEDVQALCGVSFAVSRGEFVAIAGPSGSGKSTLLNLMGGLDAPSSGQVFLADRAVGTMSGRELSDFRRDHIGFVFQALNLIPVLRVEENVEYVMLLQGVPKEERRRRVAEILQDVGLAGTQRRLPPTLSGGQQQRVAFARAIVSCPDIILADEPTANLDSKTGAALIARMRELNERHGLTFIFSTHDLMIMEQSRRLITLHDGRIEKDETLR